MSKILKKLTEGNGRNFEISRGIRHNSWTTTRTAGMRLLIAVVFCRLEFSVQLIEIKRHSDCQKEKAPHNKASNQTTVS